LQETGKGKWVYEIIQHVEVEAFYGKVWVGGTEDHLIFFVNSLIKSMPLSWGIWISRKIRSIF